MTDVLNLAPVVEELSFAHGDTFVWERVYKDQNGNVVDISSYGGFELTVNQVENPTDETQQIFLVTGTVPVGTDGRILWQFSTANWSAFVTAMGQPPATAYYDLEQVDPAGNKRTIRKGRFIVTQDINKP